MSTEPIYSADEVVAADALLAKAGTPDGARAEAVRGTLALATSGGFHPERAAEYVRLAVQRERLIAAGVDEAELLIPESPRAAHGRTVVELCDEVDRLRKLADYWKGRTEASWAREDQRKITEGLTEAGSTHRPGDHIRAWLSSAAADFEPEVATAARRRLVEIERGESDADPDADA